MNQSLFPQTGKCENCKEIEELEEVVIDGKKKWFCDACAKGYRIELEEKDANLN